MDKLCHCQRASNNRPHRLHLSRSVRPRRRRGLSHHQRLPTWLACCHVRPRPRRGTAVPCAVLGIVWPPEDLRGCICHFHRFECGLRTRKEHVNSGDPEISMRYGGLGGACSWRRDDQRHVSIRTAGEGPGIVWTRASSWTRAWWSHRWLYTRRYGNLEMAVVDHDRCVRTHNLGLILPSP